MHVHTEASHDSPGKLADVLAAARGAGVRWVALTEHTKPGRTGPYGELDGVVVLPGFEASAAGGSLLAHGVTEPPPRTRDPAALVRWTRAAGGVAVVGHFERSRLGEPAAFAAAAPDAIELVNLHANSEARRGALFWRVPLLPGATALRTLVFLRPDNYARWAALHALADHGGDLRQLRGTDDDEEDDEDQDKLEGTDTQEIHTTSRQEATDRP